MKSLKMIIAGLFFTSAMCTIAAPTYQAVDLGLLNGDQDTLGYDLNSRNMAIGYADDNVYWTRSTGTKLMPEPTPARSTMQVINDAGSMAGVVITKNQRRAVVVTRNGGPKFFLEGTWAADSLADYPILDISNKGEILGMSEYPWLWSEALGLRAIGDVEDSLAVNRVNDSGHVVGQRNSSNPFCFSYRAFIYDSRARSFSPLDGGPPNLEKAHCDHDSNATALNNKGQVVGHSKLVSSDDVYGFIWSEATGFVQLTATDSRMVDIQPMDINDKGQVLGIFRYSDSPLGRPYSYFYWDAETGVVDLQTLLDPQDPVTSDVVLWRNDWTTGRINNNGTIMVAGKLRSAPPPRLIPANRTFVLLARPG